MVTPETFLISFVEKAETNEDRFIAASLLKIFSMPQSNANDPLLPGLLLLEKAYKANDEETLIFMTSGFGSNDFEMDMDFLADAARGNHSLKRRYNRMVPIVNELLDVELTRI